MALRKPQKNVEAVESLIRNPSQKSFFLLLKIKKLQETYCFLTVNPQSSPLVLASSVFHKFQPIFIFLTASAAVSNSSEEVLGSHIVSVPSTKVTSSFVIVPLSTVMGKLPTDELLAIVESWGDPLMAGLEVENVKAGTSSPRYITLLSAYIVVGI